MASLSLVFLGLWLGQSLGILTGGTGQRQAAADVRAVRLPVRQHHARPDDRGRPHPEAAAAVVPVPGLRGAGLCAGPGRGARPDRAVVARGAGQRGRRRGNGRVRQAGQGGRVHDLLGLRRSRGRDDRAVAGPRQTRRERVHRQLLTDGLDRVLGDRDHRRPRFGAGRRRRSAGGLRPPAALPAGRQPVRLVRRHAVRRPVRRHPGVVHLRLRHRARRAVRTGRGGRDRPTHPRAAVHRSPHHHREERR